MAQETGVVDVTYDPQADTAYISFSSASSACQVPLDNSRVLDFALDGSLVGVEILSPSLGVDLSGLPRAREVSDAMRGLGFAVTTGGGG
jgi:uncharacterized protein YuzE